MESSRSALAPVAVLASLFVLSAGFLSLRNSEAKPKVSPREEKSPGQPPAIDRLKPLRAQKVPNAPLAPVATGLAQRTITLLAIKTIDFSPNGKLVAVGGGDGTARVWDFDKQDLWHAEQVHAGWLFDLQFHPDGKSLITGGGDNAIKIWSFGEKWKARLLEGHTDDVHGVAFTPDGKRVVSGSDDTTVRVWDLQTGKGRIVGRHDRQVTDVAVHPEGHLAASSSRDGTIRLWNLDNMQPAGVLQGHTADVLAIAFSPDGSQLASASYDKTVRLWDLSNKLSLVRTFEKHQDWAFCVAFSPDGKRLASGGGDRKVFVWDLEDGQLLQEIEQPSDVSAVAFSPDGKHFVAALIDGFLQLYRTGDQLEHFGVIPPPGFMIIAGGNTIEELPTDEFLKLHTDLLHPQSKTWDASVGKLTLSGDDFTLALLEKIDPETLNAPKREMWTRARETLRFRSQTEVGAEKRQRLEPRLRRAASAEMLHHPLQEDLKSWTFDTIRSQMKFSGIREELERIRADEPASSKAADRAIDERVHTWIDQLLKEFPEKQPAPDGGDPPKVEEEPKPEPPERKDL